MPEVRMLKNDRKGIYIIYLYNTCVFEKLCLTIRQNNTQCFISRSLKYTNIFLILNTMIHTFDTKKNLYLFIGYYFFLLLPFLSIVGYIFYFFCLLFVRVIDDLITNIIMFFLRKNIFLS